MTRLIKSDFKKFFHDKLFIVVCILAVVFAVTTPLLYALIFSFAEDIDPFTQEMLSGYVTAKGQFFGAFSFGNNLGLIAPLLIGIVFFKDFSYGTIRNKIISGHSRRSIFLSIFITCTTVLFGIVLAHSLLTLGVSLPFFDYQTTPFAMQDFLYLLESLLFEFLVYIFIGAFVSWLCVTMKNIGTVIVLYIAVVFGCTMIAGILQGVTMVLSLYSDMTKIVDVLDFFQRINVFNLSATIGLGTKYSVTDACYYVITPIFYTAALLGLGMWSFEKKDIK